MGTSVSQSSPRNIKWDAVRASYKDDDIPINRVLSLIWRAATNQPEGDWEKLLKQPIVSDLRDIAIQRATDVEIATDTSRKIAQSKQASLVADIAQRAAVQSASSKERALSYSERVFVEASNYLISRDLPGYVGAGGRNLTVSDSLKFKAAILDAAAQVVREVGGPSSSSARAWGSYVSAVVKRLKTGVK